MNRQTTNTCPSNLMTYGIILTKWSVKSHLAPLPCHVPREIIHKETHHKIKIIDNGGFKKICFMSPFIDRWM